MRPVESKNSQEENELKELFFAPIQPAINLHFALAHFIQKLNRINIKLQQPNLTKKQTLRLINHASHLEQQINALKIESEQGILELKEYNRKTEAILQVVQHAGTDITPEELGRQLEAAINTPPESKSVASESQIINALQTLSLVTNTSSSQNSTTDEQPEPGDTNLNLQSK